ncbi:MAG: hypothetical protein KBD25_00885 [Rickettsiaceae bacterium]|nr:hypothetical protein [Rickettsiaceae bacterium]
MELKYQFNHITDLIIQAQHKTFKLVNRSLINLYWQIGQYISNETQKNNWGKQTVEQLASYIAANNIEKRGFSARNLWRMKQFYECYKDYPKLSALLTEINWTNHLKKLSVTDSQLYIAKIFI